MLQEQHLVFVVFQEHAGGKERVQLGTVKLNLAEYVNVEKETRRYLMQDSKINSTVKIGISMVQVGGEANFHTYVFRVLHHPMPRLILGTGRF